MKKIVFSLLVSLSCITLQAQNGSISGKIIDAKTGEDLVGVIVQIESIGLGAATDLFGSYSIKNIPAGTYEVSAMFVSYETKKITGVVVQAGKETGLDITLSDKPLETGTVDIVEIRNTNTEAAVLME